MTQNKENKENKEEKALEFVGPHELEKFQGSEADKANVSQQLTRLGFPVTQYSTEVNEALVAEAKALVEISWDRLQKGEAPCYLLLGNNYKILQSLAELTPIIFSYSTIRSCYKTSTATLVDLFKAKSPRSEFDPDPAGDALREIERAGMLVWTGLGTEVKYASEHAGRFESLMSKRFGAEAVTVFTATYSGDWNGSVLDSLFKTVGSIVGKTTSSMLYQACRVRRYTVPIQAPTVKKIEIGGF